MVRISRLASLIMFFSVFLNTITMWFYPLLEGNRAYLMFAHRFSLFAFVLMLVGVFLENLFKGE